MDIDNGRLYEQSNQAAIDYAKNAIQFAFLLNGAAATTMFAQITKGFETAAITFTVGAIFAVFTMAFSYVLQSFLSETWRQDCDPIIYMGLNISLKSLEILRFCIGGLWLVSMMCTIIGICCASNVV